MNSYKEKYKISIVNFYLIILLLLFSSISHFIASKIVVLPLTNIPLMASSFTYPAVLVITNLVRAYSNKLNAIKFIAIEFIFILSFILIAYFLTLPASPSWNKYHFNFSLLFLLVFSIYKANFIGIVIMSLIDIFLFSLLFNKVFFRCSTYLNFMISNVFSNIIVIVAYVYVTDYQFLYYLYPMHWLIITNYNLISDIIMIIFYSSIFSFIFKYINQYINQP